MYISLSLSLSLSLEREREREMAVLQNAACGLPTRTPRNAKRAVNAYVQLADKQQTPHIGLCLFMYGCCILLSMFCLSFAKTKATEAPRSGAASKPHLKSHPPYDNNGNANSNNHNNHK